MDRFISGSERFARRVKTTHHCSSRNPERLGDLGVTKVLEIFHRKNLPMLGGDLLKSGDDHLTILGFLGHVVRAAFLEPCGRIGLLVLDVSAPHLAFGQEIQAVISQDPVEPGVERVKRLKSRQRRECLGKTVLAGIRSIGHVPQEARRVEEGFTPICRDEELEAARVTMDQAKSNGFGFIHVRYPLVRGSTRRTVLLPN